MTQKIAIAGATGRMGRMLIEAVLGASDLSLAAALDRADSPDLGTDAGAFLGRATGVKISADLAALAGCDVLIDFTRPEGTLAHLAACVRNGVKLVIGTTGFDDAGKDAITAAAQQTAIVFAPNMSVGVNATFKLLELAARILNSGYDIEIVEAHHRHKVDAPSGTALRMGEVIAGALGHEKATPASARPAASASPPCAAATSSVITRCCSPAPASASRSRTRAPAAWATRSAACARRAFWPAAIAACSA